MSCSFLGGSRLYGYSFTQTLLVAWCLTHLSLVDSDDQTPASPQQSSARFVNYRPVEMDPRALHILNNERPGAGSSLDVLQSHMFLLGFLLLLVLVLVLFMRRRGNSRVAKDNTKPRIPNYQRTVAVHKSGTSLRPLAAPPRSATTRSNTAAVRSTLTSTRSQVAPTSSPLHTTRLSLARHNSTCWTLVGRSVGSKETRSKEDSKIPWLRRWCFPSYSPLKTIHTCLHYVRAAKQSQTPSVECSATQEVLPTVRPSTAYLSPQTFAVASQPSSNMIYPHCAETRPQEQPDNSRMTRSNSRSSPVKARVVSTKAQTDDKCKFTTKLDITVVESASVRADSRREKRQVLVQREITPSQHEPGQRYEDRIHDSITLSSAVCDKFATETSVSAYIMPRSDPFETTRTHKKGQVVSEKKVQDAKKGTEDPSHESTDRGPGLTMDRFKNVECLKATDVTDKLFFSHCDSDVCHSSEADAQLKYQTKFGQSLSKCQKTSSEVEIATSSQQPAAESRDLLQNYDTEQDQHTTISSVLCADDAVSDLLSGNLTSTCRKVCECGSVYSLHPALAKEPHAHRSSHRAAEFKSNLRTKIKLEEIEEVSETAKDTDTRPTSPSSDQGSRGNKSDRAFSGHTSPPTTTTQLHDTSPGPTTNSGKKLLHRGKTPVDKLPRKPRSDGTNKKAQHTLTYLSLAPEISLRIPKKESSKFDGPLAALTYLGRGQQRIPTAVKPNVADQSKHHLLDRDLGRKRSHKAREFCEMKGRGSSNNQLIVHRDCKHHAGTAASPLSGKPRASTPTPPLSDKPRAGTPTSLHSGDHQLKTRHQYLKSTMYALPNTEPRMFQRGKLQELPWSHRVQDGGDPRSMSACKQKYKHQQMRSCVSDEERCYQDPPGDRSARSSNNDRKELYVAYDGERKISMNRKIGLPVSTPDQSISDSMRHVSDWLASLSQEKEFPRGLDLQPRGKSASLGDSSSHLQTPGTRPNVAPGVDEQVTSVQDEEEIARQLITYKNATYSSHLTKRASTEEASQVASLRLRNNILRKTTRDNGVSRELLYSSPEVNSQNQQLNKVRNRQYDRRASFCSPTSYSQKSTSKSAALVTVSPERDFDRDYRSNQLSRRRLVEAGVARQPHTSWPGKGTPSDNNKLSDQVMDAPSYLPAPGNQQSSGCLPDSCQLSSASERTVSEPITLESSNFAQIPIFTNRNKESVNIIVQMDPEKHSQIENNTLVPNIHQTARDRLKSRARGSCSPVLHRFGSRHSPSPTDARLQAVSFSKSRMISRNKEHLRRTIGNYTPSENQQLTRERSTRGSIRKMRQLDHQTTGFGHTRFYHLAQEHMSPRKKMTSAGLTDRNKFSQHHSYLGITSVPSRITRLSGLSSLEDNQAETKASSGNISRAEALSDTRLSVDLDKHNLSEEGYDEFKDVNIPLQLTRNRQPVHCWHPPECGRDILEVPKQDRRFKSPVSQRRAAQSKTTGRGQYQTSSPNMATRAGQSDSHAEDAQEPILGNSLSPTEASKSVKEMLLRSSHSRGIQVRRESYSVSLAARQHFKFTGPSRNPNSTLSFQSRTRAGDVIPLAARQKNSEACATSSQAPGLEMRKPSSLSSQTRNFKHNGIDSRPQQQEICSSLQQETRRSLQSPHQQSAFNPRPDTHSIRDSTLTAKNSRCSMNNREIKLQGEESITNDNVFEQETNYKTNELPKHDRRLLSQKYVKRLANEKYDQTALNKKGPRQAAYQKDHSHGHLANQRQLLRTFSPSLASKNRWKQSVSGVKPPGNTTENRSCADLACSCWHLDTGGRDRYSAAVFQSRQLKLTDARTSDSQFSDLDDPSGRGSPGRTTSIQSRDYYKNQLGKKSGEGYKLSSEDFESFPVVGHARGQAHPSSEEDAKGKNLSYTDYATAKEQTVQLEHPRDLRSSSQCSTQFSDVDTWSSNVSPQGNVLDSESQTVATPSAKGRNVVHQPLIIKQKRYFHSFSSSPASRNEREKFLSDDNKELKSFTSERKHIRGHESFGREGSHEISKMLKRKEKNGDLTARTAKMDTNAATKAHVLKFDRVSGLSTSSTAVSLNQAWTETTAKISPRQARLIQAEATINPGADSFHKSLTQNKQGYVTHGQSCLLRKIFKSCLGPATSLDEHGERESVKASVTRLHKYQPRVAKIRSLHKLMNARSRSGHLIRKGDLSLRRTHSFFKSCRAKYDRIQKETTGQHGCGSASDQQHDVNNTSSHQTISKGSCVARHSNQPEDDGEISAEIVSAIEDLSRLPGRVHDDKEAYADDCCLPDRLPNKIDGSTDGTSRSDVSLLQVRDSLGRPESFMRTPNYNFTAATLDVDPLRYRYLQELMAKSSSFHREANKGQQNTDTTASETPQHRVGQETTTEKLASCTLSAPLSKVSDLTRSIHSPKAFQPSNNAVRPGVKRKWPVDELHPGKTQAGRGSQNQHGHQRNISNTPTNNSTDRPMNINPERPMNPRDKQREAVLSWGGQSQTLVKQMSSENGKASPRSAQISKSNSCTSGFDETNTHVSRPETNSSRANETAKSKQLRDDSAKKEREGVHQPKDLGDDGNVTLQETSENSSTIDQGGSRSTQLQDGDMKVKNASYTIIRVSDSHAKTGPVGEARPHNSQGATVTQPLQGDQQPQDVTTGSRLEGKRSSYQTTAGATVHLFKRQKLFPTPVNKKTEVQTNCQKIQSAQRRSLQQTEPSSVDQNDIGLNKSKNITVRQTSLEGVKKPAMGQAQNAQRKNGSGPDQPTDLPAPQHTAETSSSNTDVALSWVVKSVTHETHDSEGDSLPASVSRPDPPHVPLPTVCGYLGEAPTRECYSPTLDKLKRELKDQDDVRNNTLVDNCQHKDVETERLSMAGNTHKADTTSNPPGDEKLACAKQLKTPVYHGHDVPAVGGADSLVPFWAKKPQLGSHTAPLKGRTRQNLAGGGRNNNVATNHTQDVLSQPKLMNEKTIRESAIGARAAKTNKQIIPQGEYRRASQNCGREQKFASNPVTPAAAQHNNSKGLAKNRRYVSSALMYTMKKQNAQYTTTRKEAALGSNNSARSDTANSGLPPQPSSQLPLFNMSVNWDCFRVLPEDKDKQQTVANQKFPITYRLFQGNANNDTSVTLTRQSPKYSSSQSDSSYEYTSSPTRHETAEAATASLNRDMEESYLQKSISALNNLPPGFGQDLPQNDQASQVATVDTHVVETTNSAEEQDGDSSESKSSASFDNLPLQSGYSLRVASSCKVNFDWYKPSANRVSPDTDTRSSHGSRTESSQATGDLCQAANEEQGLPGDMTQPTDTSDVQHNECQCFKSRVPPQQRRQPHVCRELEFPPDVFRRTLAAPSHSQCSKRHTHKQTCACMLPETSVPADNSPHCSRCSKDLHPPSYVCPGQTSHYCHGAKIHNTAHKMTLSSELGEHPASRAANVRPLPSNCPLPAQQAHSNMSSLNLVYQSLQHKYNEANAFFHSNWMLANQNIATRRPAQHTICCNRGDNQPVSQHMPPSSYHGASIPQPLCPCTYFPTPLFSNCPTPDPWTSGGDTSPNYFSDSLHGRQPGRMVVNENIFLVDDCCCAPLHLSGLCPATPTLIPVVHPSATPWLHPVPQQSVSTSQNSSSSSNPILSRPPEQCPCLEAAWFQTAATTSSRATPGHLHYPGNPVATSQAAPNNDFFN